MDDDQLRSMLRLIDPASNDVPVVAPDSPEARRLLEDIMNTPVIDTPSDEHLVPRPAATARRRVIGGLLAAAAVAAAVTVGVVVTRDDDQPATTMAFLLPDATSLSSCLPFDVSFLAPMPNAFKGTATGVTDTDVTLSVDRWYASESDQTDEVTLAVAPNNTSASLDGVTFVEGETYFVTATNGTVNGCGFSGPSTPGLEAAFATAFGS
ncbi:MAG: hypothetical protein ABIW84_03380 [Ilumatobacteraceae bacterium]